MSELKSTDLPHFPFPKIPSFHNWVKDYNKSSRDKRKAPVHENKEGDELEFFGTIKIHGTNAALVQRPDGRVYGQGRNRIVTKASGNQFNFAEWYGDADTTKGESEEHKTRAARAAAITKIMTWIRSKLEFKVDDKDYIILYGEFAGRGVQKHVAVSELKQKGFFAFGCRVQSSPTTPDRWLDIREMGANIEARDLHIYNLTQFKTYRLKIHLTSEGFQAASKTLQEWANEVEAECPVSKELGAKGKGEGIVFASNLGDGSSWLSNVFKSKGATFLDTDAKEDATDAALGKVQTVTATQDFAKRATTVVRMEKALDALREKRGGSEVEDDAFDLKDIPAFIKWLVDDIIAEEKHDIVELGIKPAQLKQMVGVIAVSWFKKRFSF